MNTFSRPYQILGMQNNKREVFFSRNKKETNKIFLFSKTKKKLICKKIKTIYSTSIFCRYLNNTFFEIDQQGTGIILRKSNGEKIREFKFSKSKLRIESAIYNKFEKKLLLIDSIHNQIYKIIFLLNELSCKNFKINKNILNLNESCFENFKFNNYIISNYNNELFILNKNFKIIKKINSISKSHKTIFRKIKSIKYHNGIIAVCDYLAHQIKFFDINFKHLISVGGKGKEKNRFDLPNNIDVFKNTFLVSDFNNDRIVKITKSFLCSIILKSSINGNKLRRPIKVLEYNKKIFVLDRDNYRIIKYNLNLKFQKKIAIKKFYNGKPNSFVLIKFKHQLLIAVLYRFTNYTNKIIFFNLNGEFTCEINLDLKDAQDITCFDKNIIVADTNNRRLILYNIETKKVKIKKLTSFTRNKLLLTKTVSCDKDGHIYTADFDKCIILKFNSKVKLIKKFKFDNIIPRLKVIRSVYVYKNYLFITNRSKYSLIIYDLIRKKIINRIDGYLFKKKKYFLANPTSVCFYNNNIFVADKENDAVVKIKL